MKMITARKLAERLNLSIGTLANWRWKKEGPKFKKVGWMVLYPLTEVVKWEKKYLN